MATFLRVNWTWAEFRYCTSWHLHWPENVGRYSYRLVCTMKVLRSSRYCTSWHLHGLTDRWMFLAWRKEREAGVSRRGMSWCCRNSWGRPRNSGSSKLWPSSTVRVPTTSTLDPACMYTGNSTCIFAVSDTTVLHKICSKLIIKKCLKGLTIPH